MDDLKKLSLVNQAIQHAKKANFYNPRLPSVPLPTLDALKEIPFTSTGDIQNASPYGMVAVGRKQLVQYHESSGTTGQPKSVWYSKKDLLEVEERINRCGVKFYDKDIVLIRFPYALSTISHFMHRAAQLHQACVIPADSRTTITPMPRVIDMLKRLEVTVLCCMSLQAIMLAEVAEMLGLDPKLDFPKLRAICTAGEPLTKYRRELLESIWGVPVYDNYGMTEIGTAMVECEHQHLHLFDDGFHAEVLEDDGKTDVSPGGKGNLVITTLGSKATPLIRYQTGDVVRVKNEQCSCGKYPSFEIRGRKEETLHINGWELDRWDLDEMVSSFPCRRFWKVGKYEQGLLFLVEVEKEDDMITDQPISYDTEKYDFPVVYKLVEKGTLYDRKDLLSFGMKGKPHYFLSGKELKEL